MKEHWFVTPDNLDGQHLRRRDTALAARQLARVFAEAKPGTPILVYRLVKVVTAPVVPATAAEEDPEA